jgi:MFS family permease
VIWSNGSPNPARRPRSAVLAVDERGGSGPTGVLFAGVLALLLATGWAANHFAALMPVFRDHQHLGTTTIDAIFGIYALGLVPGLLFGGRASDALGRQSVAWAGSAGLLAGTMAMLFSQQPDVLLVGRFTVGLGVGLATSSCTAWASDLKGPRGAATAGAVLTTGFAIGPFAAGVIALVGEPGIRLSFGVAAAFVVAAMVLAVAAAQRTGVTVPATADDSERSIPEGQGTARALSWAMPLAPWVFASVTLGFVTIPTRVHTGLAAPVAAGTAALIVNGSSGLIQMVARARRWGPHTGTTGALLAAFGYAATAAAPSSMSLVFGLPLLLVLGCGSGLCLREGLIDLEAAAPPRGRGALTGLFYTVTYVGFGLPLLLATVGSAATVMILAAMAVLASAAAVSRAVRLRRDGHRQN